LNAQVTDDIPSFYCSVKCSIHIITLQ
jgi:hypothetical protein